MSRLINYDPTKVIVSFGPLIIGGWDEEEMLEFEPEGEGFEDKVGVDGEVTVTPDLDARGNVTLHLMQTSASNDGLSTIYNLAKKNRKMAGGIHPFQVKDMYGRFLLFSANAWIKNKPNTSFGKTAKGREWVIRLAHAEGFDGGN